MGKAGTEAEMETAIAAVAGVAVAALVLIFRVRR